MRDVDGATQIPAKLVVAEGLRMIGQSGLVRAIAHPGVGVKEGIAEIFKGTAVKLLRARARHLDDDATVGFAILRRIGGGENLHAGQTVHIRDAGGGSVGASADHGSAVERDQNGVIARAIDGGTAKIRREVK